MEYFLIKFAFKLYFLKSMISTQNDVVREVKAESAEERAEQLFQ